MGYLDNMNYDFICETKNQARDVISKLREIITTYGVATVSDLCGLCGVSSSYCDTYYGWKIIDCFVVSQYGTGWKIEPPEPISIYARTYRPYNTGLAGRRVKYSYTSTDEPTPEPLPLNIIVHTNETSDPDAILAEIFKYIYTIKDRMVNLTIM